MTTISWQSVSTDSFLYVQTSWRRLLLLKIAKDVRLLALGTGQEALYSATGLAIEGRDMLIIFSSDILGMRRALFSPELYLGVTFGPRTSNLRRRSCGL